VNNAGIALPSMSVVDVDAPGWRRVLDVNLKSMLFCCQAVGPRWEIVAYTATAPPGLIGAAGPR